MSDITKMELYGAVADLDPLGFDETAAKLPDYNTRGYLGHVATEYSRMLDVAEDAMDDFDPLQATAALRDLDFVAGSLLNQGAAVLAEQELAQRVLGKLGRRAGTVPRGTVFTYTAGNPTDSRARSFTGTAGENLFIDAVREGIWRLDDCMDGISAGAEGDVYTLASVPSNMNGMVESMITVKKGITPEFFTYKMRPYFDALNIGGEEYAGAGGAQMQLIAVDRMLWGADSGNEIYQGYYADNVRYLTPEHRAEITAFENKTDGMSLITMIEKGVLPQESILPARAIVRSIRKFRFPHRKVAQDNFVLRAEGSVGSGQYTTTILDHLVELNDEAATRLDAINV